MRVDFDENKRFAYRVAGLAVRGEKVLLHRAESDDFWTLPGGSCEFFESSRESLTRELREEVGAHVSVGRLLWIVENFFEFEAKQTHEIGLYYAFDFVSDSKRFCDVETFTGMEYGPQKGHAVRQPYKLHFKWFKLNDLRTIEIKPSFLTKHLLNIPQYTIGLVHRDVSTQRPGVDSIKSSPNEAPQHPQSDYTI